MPRQPKQAARSATPTSFQKDGIGTEVHRPISLVMSDPLRTPDPSANGQEKGLNRRYFRCRQRKLSTISAFYRAYCIPSKGE
jgi:hypothetical protein